MAYIETALVSSSGKLLIQLDDGTVIDAGYVKGERGPAGRDGQDGAPGIPGARGEAGTNGSKWFTGVGAPDVNEGDNGDLYLDVASAMLPIYQKVGNDWIFLANLKASIGGGVSGGEGTGGGGGNIIVFPSPGQPTTDEDGNPVNKGDLWYDPTTGWLYVYNQNQWVVVAGDPPVLVSAMPPDQDLGEDPIQVGSLWFDSEQLALYVAAKDANGNMVWVIATPSDRSAVDDTVNIPFRPPGFAANGAEATNPVSGIVYVYNAAKKQWIDKAPKSGGAYYQELAPDPNVENLRPGDLWIDSDNHNLYVWTGDTWSQVNPGCNSNPKVHFQPSAPGGTQHIRGDLWIDSDTNKLFTWNGDVWMEVGASCGGPGTEEFVKIAGDTMTGPLILEDEDGNIAEITLSRQAVHKTYVDDQDAKLQQEIINLEEEINNIQASVEGGRWDFTVNPSVTAGQFRMSNGLFTQFNQTITIHRKDLVATDHYWAQSEIGHYLEILDQTIGSTNNALYKITDITKDTGTEETVFTLELVRGTGAPTNGQPCVIKTFELQGGDPTAYVRKVGDVMTGPLRLQDDNGNPSQIVLQDEAVHKQYVDEAVFGQDRECVLINGGKLCGGESLPRFYKAPIWTEKQKTAGTFDYINESINRTCFYYAALDRWYYYVPTTSTSSAKGKIEIYMSSTSDINSSYSLWVRIYTEYSDTNLYKVTHLGASSKYIFVYQEIVPSTWNDSNNKRAKIYRIKQDKSSDIIANDSSLAGYQIKTYAFDSERNFSFKVERTHIQSRDFITQYYIYHHDEATGNVTSHVVAWMVSNANNAFLHNSLNAGFNKTLDTRGFYWHVGQYSGYNSNYGDPANPNVKMFYIDSGGKYDITSKITGAKHYFGYYSSGAPNTKWTIQTDVGVIFGSFFYSKQSKRFMCIVMNSSTNKFTLDGTMGYKIYRSAEYNYGSIDWKNLNWATLFNANNGGELVLEVADSYPMNSVYQVGKEILSVPLTGYLSSTGTAGDPIKKLPYGKVWGSVDGGDSWEERRTDIVDENNNPILNHYPRWVNWFNQRAFNDDTELHIYFGRSYDTVEPFYNDLGKIDTLIDPDPLLPSTHQMYKMPFSIVDGVQALYWNGVQIYPPLP